MVLTPQKGESEVKHKYTKKDKKIKKSKSPKNAKKIVSKKKAARRLRIKIEDAPADLAPGTYTATVKDADAEIVTLGFVAEPETLADRADEAHEPIPGDPTESV